MKFIPTRSTLKYEMDEYENLVVRDIWFQRGSFYLDGTEHELMVTPMDTLSAFDKVVIRLTQEMKQINMYIPNLELSISLVEAYLTLPPTLEEDPYAPIHDEIIDRVCKRLEPVEMDIIGINKLSPHAITGEGDALDFMRIVRGALTVVHSRLLALRKEGYYFGCTNPETLDIVLVRPYN